MKSLDLVCKRYPGNRPSEYMGLEGYDGLRYDIACAYLGEYSEYDRENALNDEIINCIVALMKVNGAKRVKAPKRERLVAEFSDKKEVTFDDVKMMLLTPGTVME